LKADSVVRDKSFAFSVRIVKLYQYLNEEKREFILSKQVLRSGTSIGANIEESLGGQSSKDFLSKLSIGYKEARETIYWIRLLSATGYLDNRQAESLISDAEELCKILTSILLTIKKK
jgi:four helix bundle protein